VKSTLAFCLLFWLSSSAIGQSVQITTENGRPLSDAQLLYLSKGEQKLSFSENGGFAALSGIDKKSEVRVSLLGFQTRTLLWSDTLTVIPLTKADYDLGEVVITGQYRPVKVSESVHSIRTIDAEAIEARAAVTLEDVLRNELNFRVSRDNILGAGMAMQGINGENVKIMIDGVPVVGRLNGNIDLSQINLNQVERIEIVEGPLAVNYGSNALAGTINLITKSPKSEETTAEASLFTESIGHFNANGSVSTGIKKQSISVSGGRNFFNGWSPGDDFFYHQVEPVADERRAQQWNPREQVFADAKYRLALKNGYFEAAGSYFDEEIINRGAPMGAYGERAFDDHYLTKRYSGSLKFQGSLSQRWNTHHLVAYNIFDRVKSTYITNLTGVYSELSPNAALQDTTSFRTFLARGSFIGQLSEKINIQIGYEAEIEEGAGERIVDANGIIENYALFATAEFRPMDRLTIKPGLRVAHNSRYAAPPVPSINFLYQLPGDIETRLSYAQGFRAPGLKELSFYFVDINHNIVGNPELDAERSHNISASLNVTQTESRAIGIKASGFYNRIFNLITLAQAEEQEFTYVNIGERETVGGRMEANTQWRGIDLGAGLSYTGISNKLSTGREFTFTPEATLRAGYEWNEFSFNAFYKFNGRQIFLRELSEGKVTEESIDAFQNLDLTLAKSFAKRRIRWEIGGRNLLNVQNLNATVSGGAHSTGGSMAIGTGRTIFTRLTISIVK